MADVDADPDFDYDDEALAEFAKTFAPAAEVFDEEGPEFDLDADSDFDYTQDPDLKYHP